MARLRSSSQRCGGGGSESLGSRNPGSGSRRGAHWTSQTWKVSGPLHQRNVTWEQLFQETLGEGMRSSVREFTGASGKEAEKEGEFENVVKAENCYCVIPGEVGVDGSRSFVSLCFPQPF